MILVINHGWLEIGYRGRIENGKLIERNGGFSTFEFPRLNGLSPQKFNKTVRTYGRITMFKRSNIYKLTIYNSYVAKCCDMFLILVRGNWLVPALSLPMCGINQQMGSY